MPNNQPTTPNKGHKVIVDLTKKIAPIVAIGYKYRQIVMLVVIALAGFGVFALKQMDKNEFPPFTVREGLVVAAFPGATPEQLEQEVMKPLEEYIFSYKEVNKAKTHSEASNGMVITYVELNEELSETESFWNKFKVEIPKVKDKLPSGVLAVEVMSSFANSSALLITMSSPNKSYRELNTYMDRLKDRLRKVESVGEMNVTGGQHEQIAVYLDPQRLSKYGIGEKVIASSLAMQGFSTTSGELQSPDYIAPIRTQRALNSVEEVKNQIVYSTPTGQVVRLGDVARVEREYPKATSYVTNNGVKALVLSIEIKEGRNVVEMGREVEKEIAQFEQEIPQEIDIYRITNQPYDVNNSVTYFLTELLIAVVAVVLAIMLLLPFRVSLIAAGMIPIAIFISIALFYIFGFEINTVTLACLIVSLGMIVDDSVVIVDNYEELIAEGVQHRLASLSSATEFFRALVAATFSISMTFFPFLITMTGMFRDFLTDFPWAITIILFVSLICAEMVVPFLQLKFIHKAPPANAAATLKQHVTILGLVQAGYDKLINFCFRWSKTIITVCVLSIVAGCLLFISRPLKLMPVAERNQFAVEIRMPTGTPLEKTTQVADSLSNILRRDHRVKSVAIFHGTSSPRFQATYAPQIGGSDYAQFIVNTESNQATVDILNEYTPKYSTYFPGARVRFKQLNYSQATNPVEVRIKGPDYGVLKSLADSVATIMRATPGLTLVHTSQAEPQMDARIESDIASMQRLGLDATALQLSLAMRYTSGFPVSTVYEGDYGLPVVLKTSHADSAKVSDITNSPIPTAFGTTVPVSQFASVHPIWHPATLSHRNGVRVIDVNAEIDRDKYAVPLTGDLRDNLKDFKLPDGYTLEYGGDWDITYTMIPHLAWALLMAVVIIFFILLFYYKHVRTSLLLTLSLVVTVPGAAVGLVIMGQPLSMTCTLGLISLMGILVRNAIIMLDYARELQKKLGLDIRESSLASAKRRLRPIVLTSSAASMGVIPMMLSDSALWQPMGTVIFWGTIITLFYTLVFIPLVYWKITPALKPTVKPTDAQHDFDHPENINAVKVYPDMEHITHTIENAKPYIPTPKTDAN